MEKILSRLNLYDILAMIVPGGMWLLCFVTILDHTTTIDARKWLWVETIQNAQPEVSVAICMGLLIFVVAYLLGLLQDSIFHWIRKHLRKIKCDDVSVASGLLKWSMEKEKTSDAKDIETLSKIRRSKKDFYAIRAKAIEDDKNGTVLTMAYQCAMIKSLLFPLAVLIALCFNTWYLAIIVGISMVLVLWGLLISRTIRQLRAILRHYNNTQRK